MDDSMIDPGTPGGWIRWEARDGEYLGGGYRIRPLAPGRWELSRRSAVVTVSPRLSRARVAAELHLRERVRRRDITVSASVAGGAVVVAVASLSIAGIGGFLGLAAALGLVVRATARMVAAATRNELDPFRRRDPWEQRAWWRESAW